MKITILIKIIGIIIVGILNMNFMHANLSKSSVSIPLQLQEFIATMELEKQVLQGGAIAILSRGKVIYQDTFGYEKGKENPITPCTIFPLASVSKPVTAIALARLVQAGEINLNQLMNIPHLKHQVSWKHLLSHTTGYHFSGNYMAEKGVPRHELLSKLGNLKPSHKPGKDYFYSNTIFSLTEEALNLKKKTLSIILTSLNKAIGEQGAQTVEMNPKIKIAFPHNKARETKGVVTPPKPMPFPSHYPKVFPAAAGIFSSLNGLIEILKIQMGYRPNIISLKTAAQFAKPYIEAKYIENWKGKLRFPFLISRVESYYGLGWRIFKSKDHKGKYLIFHSGFIGGVRAFMGYIPCEDIGIIILVNQDTKFHMQQGINFWGCFLKTP